MITFIYKKGVGLMYAGRDLIQMLWRQRFILLLLTALSLSGCGGQNHDFEYDGAFDPIEPINRAVYSFNRKLDYVTLRPVAFIYSKLPNPPKQVVENVFDNLDEPRNVVNHVLQNRGEDAVISIGRLAVNSTFGIGGIFDVADYVGLEQRKNDFGITFRAYTSNEWMYLMLPILGPTTLGDLPGVAADIFLSPLRLLKVNDEVQLYASGLAVVHGRAKLLAQEDLLETVLDEYSYVRDFREEYRRQQVPLAEDIWLHHSKIYSQHD